MIVDEGKIPLLDSQRTYLSTLTWILFTNNFTIAASTNLMNLTEAAWSGYARVTATTWTAPTVPTPGGAAVTNNSTLANFANSSGATVNFYGWALVDYTLGKLIAAVNIGLQSIPDASNYILAPSVTDNQF